MLSSILTTDNFRLFIIQSDPGQILMEEEIITTEALWSCKNSFPRNVFLENCFISAFQGH